MWTSACNTKPPDQSRYAFPKIYITHVEILISVYKLFRALIPEGVSICTQGKLRILRVGFRTCLCELFRSCRSPTWSSNLRGSRVFPGWKVLNMVYVQQQIRIALDPAHPVIGVIFLYLKKKKNLDSSFSTQLKVAMG